MRRSKGGCCGSFSYYPPYPPYSYVCFSLLFLFFLLLEEVVVFVFVVVAAVVVLVVIVAAGFTQINPNHIFQCCEKWQTRTQISRHTVGLRLGKTTVD